MEQIVQFVLDLITSNPNLSVVLTVIGFFRVIFKPLMTLIEKVVEATPTKSDDERLAKIKESKVYKGVAWVVDYLLPVKLPVKKADGK